MKYFKDITLFVTNKAVFCGIDIHLKSWNLCFFCDGQIVEKISIIGDFKNLSSHVSRLYSTAKSVHFVYEAGFSGFYLHGKLKEAGYECTNPDLAQGDQSDFQNSKSEIRNPKSEMLPLRG